MRWSRGTEPIMRSPQCDDTDSGGAIFPPSAGPSQGENDTSEGLRGGWDRVHLCNFRDRIGDTVIDQITAVAVEFLSHFGLIKGELLSTDGQLDPSYSRYKGCPYACEGCQALTLSETDRQALGEQWQGGAKRLELTCPFPEVVDKVREATANKGAPKDPKVALAPSPSLTITGATSTSMRPPC